MTPALFNINADDAFDLFIGTAIDDIRLALNQSQPLGNERFYAKIAKMAGVRREAKPRGRPRLETMGNDVIEGQGALEL